MDGPAQDGTSAIVSFVCRATDAVMVDAVEDGAPLLTVLIAVRNDAPGLRATLEALDHQDAEPGFFEVVVIDDGSDDDTAAVAHARDYVRVVSLDASGGSYVARNRGLAVARGRHIAVTDADCTPAPDWVRRGVARLEAEPRSVVAGQIAMPLGSRPTLAAMVDVMAHLDQERYVNEWGFAATANLFASAETFADVGPFDERLRSSGDAEWTRRAVRAGHELVYAPEVSVAHPPRTSIASLLGKARRIAEGASAARRLGVSERKPSYRDPVSLLPWQRARARQRLRENGVDPSAARSLLLTLAQVALVNVAQAWFWLRTDIRLLRASRARASSPLDRHTTG